LCPTDGHKPVLQRLPDRLKHRVRELAQLIEEEHTPVAKRNFARARLPAAAHESGVRDGVMRRPERPPSYQRRVRGQHPGHAVYLRDLQGLFHRHTGQDRGRRPRQQRLPCAWRPNHHHIVPTRRCNFECSLHMLLASDVLEVDAFRRVAGRQ